MHNLEEKLVKSTLEFSGRMLKLRVDEVELPNGRLARREVVEHPGAVAVVPLLSDGRVALVRQYRHPAGQVMLEIPAGKLDKGEDPGDCAARELEEETGYIASSMRKVASVYTTPGFTNEVIHIYVAEQMITSVQRLDEDEFLNVELLSRDELKRQIKAGEIIDAKTMLGLMLAGI